MFIKDCKRQDEKRDRYELGKRKIKKYMSTYQSSEIKDMIMNEGEDYKTLIKNNDIIKQTN
jgi:hypothetical protein